MELTERCLLRSHHVDTQRPIVLCQVKEDIILAEPEIADTLGKLLNEDHMIILSGQKQFCILGSRVDIYWHLNKLLFLLEAKLVLYCRVRTSI
ncbi:hypothetical protein QHL1GM_18365 [Halomonas sp. QHL1]|nr:hypothetical protein QHL1GM_18365 [Halomonas sp. QHL1]